MKKNVVLIAGSCVPVPSATGSIAIKYAEYLSKKCGFNVSIVCMQEENNKYFGKNVNDVRYFCLPNFRLNRFQTHFRKAKKTKGIICFYHNVALFFYRAVGKVVSTFFAYTNSGWFVHKAYRTLKHINKNFEHIDVVVSFNNPIEAHLVAIRYNKHFGCPFIAYMFDSIPSKGNLLNIFVTKKRLIKVEKQIISKSEKCMVTEELYAEMKQRLDRTLLDSKIIETKYCLNQLILSKQKQNDSVLQLSKCLYYGSLYKDIRNPEYMLRFFDGVEHLSLKMYVTGNCDELIKKANHYGKSIELFATVPFVDIVDNAIDSDILINIENNGTCSKPSKLFELISFGKPVLSFCKGERGFDYYGQVCNVNENKPVVENIRIVNSFLHNFKKTFTKDFLEKMYPERIELNYQTILSKIIDSLDTTF